MLVDFNNDIKTAYITGIDYINYNGFQISVYPNPANEVLYVCSNELLFGSLKYEILDLSGTIKLNGTLNKGEDVIDLTESYLSNGYYLLIIKSENEILFSEKILIP